MKRAIDGGWWRLVGISTFVSVLSGASAARASGISLGKFGGVYGHANADLGLGIYYNPARLSLDSGLWGAIDLTLVHRSASYDRVIDTESATPAEIRHNSGEATLDNFGLLPLIAAGYTADLDGVRVGGALGLFPTFGGLAEWDQSGEESAEFPGAVDGPQRWSAISSRLVILHYTLAGAVTFEEIGVSVGASVAYVAATLDTVKARNLNRSDALVDARGALQEGRVHFDATGQTWAYSLGLAFQRENVKAGFNVRPGFDLELIGPIRQAYATNTPTIEEGRLDFPLPPVLNAAVTPRFGPFEITWAGEYTGWSRVDVNNVFATDTNQLILEIPRELENTIGLRLVPGWHFDETWLGSLLIGYESSAVPRRTLEAGFMDAPKVQFGFGGSYRAEHLRVSLSWHRDQYLEQTVTESIQQPVATGSYNDRRDLFNVTVEGRL